MDSSVCELSIATLSYEKHCQPHVYNVFVIDVKDRKQSKVVWATSTLYGCCVLRRPHFSFRPVSLHQHFLGSFSVLMDRGFKEVQITITILVPFLSRGGQYSGARGGLPFGLPLRIW